MGRHGVVEAAQRFAVSKPGMCWAVGVWRAFGSAGIGVTQAIEI